MSVYVSQRREPQARFIQEAAELRKLTEEAAEKFPKSWRATFTNAMVGMARDIYQNCVRANAVHMTKGMPEADYDLRHRRLMLAGTDAKALLAEMTYAWGRIEPGSNIFQGKGEAAKFFKKWAHSGNTLLRLLARLISSDEKRYKDKLSKH